MVVRHGSIFDRPDKLKPTAMAAVADRRMADAERLLANGNVHLNGAAYLAGFVIEILLKARLLEKFPHLNTNNSKRVDESDRKIWSLIWRSHDLEEMLSQLSGLESALRKNDERRKTQSWVHLKGLCETWTIYARYSPHTIDREFASTMIDRVRNLKDSLK